MATFTTQAEIPAPPEGVFEIISDPGRSGDWQATHTGWSGEAPTEMVQGGSFIQQVTLMGMPGEVAWTVKRLDAPSALELEGTGPMGVTMRSSFSVEAVDGGSRLTVEGELGGGMLDGPMGETVAAQSKTAMEQSVERLKGLVA